MISTEIGGDNGNLADDLRTNIPPELHVEGPLTRSVKAGQPLRLVAIAGDPDNLPPFSLTVKSFRGSMEVERRPKKMARIGFMAASAPTAFLAVWLGPPLVAAVTWEMRTASPTITAPSRAAIVATPAGLVNRRWGYYFPLCAGGSSRILVDRLD